MATCRRWRLLLGMMVALGAPGTIYAEEPVVVYTPFAEQTTNFGPPAADIVLRPSNFLPCVGGPIALCYYSGPAPDDPSQPDLSCTVTSDGQFANCRCLEIPSGNYFVDINGILDVDIYLATVKKCGQDGQDCFRKPNKAPVCKAINKNRFIPGADTISTFSLALKPDFGIGQTDCPAAPYAGCMTAPCVRTGEFVQICDDSGECSSVPIDKCACPNFDGEYQVGQEDAECDIGGGQPNDNVWSAAFSPAKARTIPTPGCFPDAPDGCPLLAVVPDSDPLEPIIPAKPGNISCGRVCAEYRNSRQNGVEVGLTCAATLCTATGVKNFDLRRDACSGVGDGKISETLRLQTEVGCSCCASQICGCEPSPQTNAEISMLNEMQRQRNITPQCELNGTLCGGP